MSVPGPVYAEVQCTECGWVHASISLATAMENSDSGEQLSRYFRCFHCSSPSATFVPACPDNAPAGCSLQPVVVGHAPYNAK